MRDAMSWMLNSIRNAHGKTHTCRAHTANRRTITNFIFFNWDGSNIDCSWIEEWLAFYTHFILKKMKTNQGWKQQYPYLLDLMNICFGFYYDNFFFFKKRVYIVIYLKASAYLFSTSATISKKRVHVYAHNQWQFFFSFLIEIVVYF